MVDYAYYRDEYLGELIPQKAFPGLIRQAAAELRRLCRDYVVQGGTEENAMATCAMAEELYRCAGRAGLSGAAMGSVRVQYAPITQRQLLARLYSKAAVYLDIYRGRWLE